MIGLIMESNLGFVWWYNVDAAVAELKAAAEHEKLKQEVEKVLGSSIDKAWMDELYSQPLREMSKKEFQLACAERNRNPQFEVDCVNNRKRRWDSVYGPPKRPGRK